VAQPRFVSCPRCGVQVTWRPESRYRPFCSKRCRVLDLGAWAMEKYRVPVEENKDTPDAKEPD
jgi:endogenous inhibitor of DNA gyrase (YacG/DUF329 family)